MITGELKTKIDKIWNTMWTGGITNPLTVVEQLTYLLYMKMLDEKQIIDERNALAFGSTNIKKVFKDGEVWHNPVTDKDVEYKDMRWQNFHTLGSVNMFDMVRNNVFEFIKTLGTDEDSSYSKYMSDAIFTIPKDVMLSDVVKAIDGLDLKISDKDMMGDVYEYCLSKLSTSKVNGQFRTPRHIINMMVEMAQPKLDDIISDPAMGSAGFLVSSANYVIKHYKNELMDMKKFEHFNKTMFNGYDTDPTMLRLGAMNTTLHGVASPNISYMDSVSKDNDDEMKYTLVLANPPFKGTVNDKTIHANLKAMVNTKKTELLFVAQFIRSLQLGGRCFSIVPDGVLFSTSNAYKTLRKELVDNQNLIGIVSMPSGVFKPYAGVSTAVLIFQRTDAGGTNNVWFYDMKADGFSLDDKRNPIADNDIPDIIARFKNLEGEAVRTRKDQSFLVPADEIRANDYDFSINKYKEVEKKKVEYEPSDVIMGRIKVLGEECQKLYSELSNVINED